ncbi:MAG: hypothetical protein H7Z40_06580 [Phycisphaerae bacterium]|nr:hypothetical protein [Gemmatimonadaceae bacterium]
MAASLFATSACGTALYKHEVQIIVDDPTGRLGSAPLEVSVFDSRMGTTKEFARKTVGVSSAAAPYTRNFSTTAGVLVGSEPRPDSLEFSVSVPAIIERGFFVLRVKPGVSLSGDATAGYLLHSESEPAGDGPTLQFHYSATPLPDGWALQIRLKVPEP